MIYYLRWRLYRCKFLNYYRALLCLYRLCSWLTTFGTSDSTAITLQTLNDLSVDIAEMSMDVKDYKAQMSQTSNLVYELHSSQKGKYCLFPPIFGTL